MAGTRRLGVVVGILSLVCMISGCASTESYEGSAMADFQAYKATRPVPKACDAGECPACRPPDRGPAEAIVTGEADVDLLADSVSDLYSASTHKLDNYIEIAEKSRTYAAFTNDVDACQAGKETDEEKAKCIEEIWAKMTPEQKEEVIAFQQANANMADENLRMLVGLAKMSGSVAMMTKKYKDKSWSLEDAVHGKQVVASVGNMSTKVAYMETTQDFYEQQKARMEYLKEHAGR